MPRAVALVSAALLSLLWCLLLWRAATQSLTHDEALTWQVYLTTPWSTIFQYYIPNNHFLATLLMRLSTAVFGFSELAMRLPSLGAAVLYFVTVRRLALRWYGPTPSALLAILLLSVHPLLLDFLVAARGYGLAVACFVYGFAKLIEYAEGPTPEASLLHRAAVGLSLAVAANLTLLFPCFLTAVLFLAACPQWTAPQNRARKRRKQRQRSAPAASWFRTWRDSRSFELRHFVLPAAAMGLLYLLAVPVAQTTSRGLYRVETSLASSLENLARISVAHNEGIGGINGEGKLLRSWARVLAWGVAPFTVALALWLAGRSRAQEPMSRALLWGAGATGGSLGLHGITYHSFGWPYPADRTGLYLIVLFALTLAALIAALRQRADAWRRAAAPYSLLAGILVAHSLLQLNWTHFHVWRYNADDKQIVQRLDEVHKRTRRRLSVGISWQLEPVYHYYRERGGRSWLPEFDRSGPGGEFEYYVLIRNDQDLIVERGLEVLYRGPVSGTVLARRRDPGV
ncbi:MAG: hypothetical protein RMK57_10520 [Bryobacterales bacterium]|nr:hypothetical protein [Bryobacteraceae bacterium]MDW8354950.1 hypothetical protein [Bryobacterales bacterium]